MQLISFQQREIEFSATCEVVQQLQDYGDVNLSATLGQSCHRVVVDEHFRVCTPRIPALSRLTQAHILYAEGYNWVLELGILNCPSSMFKTRIGVGNVLEWGRV